MAKKKVKKPRIRKSRVKKKAKPKKAQAGARGPATSSGPRCGLCGKAGELIKTECCEQWICDDESSYRLFSYARNSCSRNHRRYTLCGFHDGEEHEGDWKSCEKCRTEISETEMYVWYGTNEYNFELLENPPDYEPTLCSRCEVRIKLGDDGFCHSPEEGYLCMACYGG